MLRVDGAMSAISLTLQIQNVVIINLSMYTLISFVIDY